VEKRINHGKLLAEATYDPAVSLQDGDSRMIFGKSETFGRRGGLSARETLKLNTKKGEDS
jgi:hypothetical protein